MSPFFLRMRRWLLRAAVLLCATCVLVVGFQAFRGRFSTEPFVPVSLTGVHHLGDKFNISGFYVDGYDGGNVGRGGGGGSNVCCVKLPAKWRPDLSVEVRWGINDWSHENRAEIEANNYDSVDGFGYIARVPVEKYDTAAHVWVHFFADGRVRVVSSVPGSGGPKHPIQANDPRAIDSATRGRPVNALFSEAEIVEMERRDQQRKQKYGDWR